MTDKIIIDGEKAVLGRLASYAAKQALLGKEIAIINSEKVIIVGNKKQILDDYKKRRARGGQGMRGPYFPTEPERILKRTIRGMLAYKEGRGKLAFKKIMCYKNIPVEFKDKKIIKAGRGKDGMSLEEVSRILR